MADVELVALYWTTSGPTEAHTGREWSLFDFADRCAEAEKVGFTGIGLWHSDLEHILEGRSLEEMKRILDFHGMRYLQLEFLQDFFLDPGDELRRGSDERRRLLLEAAAALDALHIKVGNIPGTPCDLGQVTERYAELCAEAARVTSAEVVYEPMPFDVNVRSLEAMLEVVEGAGAPNGGLAIDTWHMAKLGIAPGDLRRIPTRHLRWVELSDGQVEDMADPVDETVNHRRLPGEGEFDIRGYVEVCREIGYAGPWGVEVLSEALRNLPMEEIFRRSYETTLAQFEPVAA